MKKVIVSAFAFCLMIAAAGCGNGNTGTDTVDSLDTAPMEEIKPKDTVYPQSDTNSFRKDTSSQTQR